MVGQRTTAEITHKLGSNQMLEENRLSEERCTLQKINDLRMANAND